MTPLDRQRPAGFLIRPLQRFFELEAAGGLLLLFCTAVALLWANLPLAGSYFRLWASTATVDVGFLAISKPLLLWINDGSMAVFFFFFFFVGLEIKRELLVGELAQPRKAAGPGCGPA